MKQLVRISLIPLSSFLILLGFRILPFIKHPLATYGYDYGFYRYALVHADKLNSFTLFGSPLGGYGNPFFYVFYHLRIPPDAALFGMILLVSIACGFMLYLLLPNKRASIAAVLLFSLSIAQSQAYTMFLLKSLIGLFLILATFAVIAHKKYWWLLLTIPSIFLIHRTTAVIAGLTLGIYLMYILILKKYYTRLAIFLLGAAGVLFLGKDYIIAKAGWLIYNPNILVREGIFFQGPKALLYELPMLILGLCGLWIYLKKKPHALFIIYFLITCAWFLLRLPFYNRILLYLDLSLIIFGAYAIAELYEKVRLRTAIAISLGLVILLGLNTGIFLFKKSPLITVEELREIETVTHGQTDAIILANSATDAPWLLGYGSTVRLAAPGLFEDHHTYEQWRDFWEGRDQQNFINDYPRPLLIYQRSFVVGGSLVACLEPISPNFSRLHCP